MVIIRKTISTLLVVAMLLAMIAITSIAGYAAGTTYYVSTTGNDNNPGTMDRPFKTIQKGVMTAQAGDTVYIRGGTYVERVKINNSGTADSKIVISGYPGESVIVDGQNTLPTGDYPAAKWEAMIQIRGSYIELRDLAVKNSRGRGVGIKYGTHNLVYGINVSYCWNSGIIVEESSYNTVENCDVWECARSNGGENRGIENWPGSLVLNKTDHCILRGNKVHELHGEGIADLRSEYSLIEDNIIYDCLKVNLYLDNSQNCTVRRNIIYHTDNIEFWRYGNKPGPGISINEETYSSSSMKHSIGQKIYNNLVYNSGIAFYMQAMDKGFIFKDSVVAYNTFVNTRTGAIGEACTAIKISNHAKAENSVIKNNIIKQDFGLMVEGPAIDGIEYSYNNWSRLVADEFSHEKDIVGDPLLELAGDTGAGQLTADFFKLKSSSPCINKAEKLTDMTEDFFGTDRGESSDIGGIEYTTVPVTAMNPEATMKRIANAVVLFVGRPEAYIKAVKKAVDPNNLEVKPIVEDGRTLVPVRFISENIGAEVSFDEATATISVKKDNKNITILLGSKKMNIDGNEKELEVPAIEVNGRTLIPLRALVEALEKQVFWDQRGLIIIGDSSDINYISNDKKLVDRIVGLY